jgi:hypothetical protein
MSASSCTLEPRPGYLLVVQHGCLESLDVARDLQLRVERACAKQGADRRVLFDNRDTDEPAQEIRESMFAWAVASFERVALLLRSDLKAVRTNMDALSRRAHVRGFVEENEATVWLCG